MNDRDDCELSREASTATREGDLAMSALNSWHDELTQTRLDPISDSQNFGHPQNTTALEENGRHEITYDKNGNLKMPSLPLLEIDKNGRIDGLPESARKAMEEFFKNNPDILKDKDGLPESTRKAIEEFFKNNPDILKDKDGLPESVRKAMEEFFKNNPDILKDKDGLPESVRKAIEEAIKSNPDFFKGQPDLTKGCGDNDLFPKLSPEDLNELLRHAKEDRVRDRIIANNFPSVKPGSEEERLLKISIQVY